MKVFRHDNPQYCERQFELLKNEYEATADFDHPNVVKYFSFGENVTWIKDSGNVQVSYIV